MQALKISSVLLALVIASGCSQSNTGNPGTLSRWYAGMQARLTNGKTESQRSLEAKKAAKSWRMKTSLSLHPGAALETEVFVSCPDRERIVTRMGDRTFQTVRIGKDAFIQGSDGQWSRAEVPKDAYPCGESAGAPPPFAMMNEGRDMATVIATMANNPKSPITVRPGSLVLVEGTSCQQWVVSFAHPGTQANAKGMSYTVCLGSSDRLPRQLVMGSGGMITTYYDWNQPVQIEAPAAAATTTASREP